MKNRINEENIKKLNMMFYEALRNRNWENKHKMFDTDVILQLSTTGMWRGIEQIEEAFFHPVTVPIDSKQNIENELLRISNNDARQSFHMLMIHVEQEKEFHYLQYGMTFVLDYKKELQTWKIVSVKADLCWIEGNSYWIKEWNLIDYHIPKRRIPIIKPEDSIWYLPCLERSENEMIKEAVLSYGWIIDTEDYDCMPKIMKETIEITDGYHGKAFYGINEWKKFLITLNEKEACLHHTYQIDHIEIEGHYAKVRMVRMEPNRIGSKVIGRHNWKHDWFTLIYDIRLEKDGDVWKIETVNFHKSIFERNSTGCFSYGV